MRTRIIALMAGIALLVTSLPTTAAIVELPLDCAGTYDLDNLYWTSDFDLGVTFTEIFHVYIDWSGEITGALVTDDAMPDPFPIDVGIYASLGSNPFLRRITAWGGEASYPDAQPFDLQSEFELVGGSTWSDLLDGQGPITIGYTELIIPGTYVEHGSVGLHSATLVVDGTIVPEPTTLVLFSVGAICVRYKYWKKQLN